MNTNTSDQAINTGSTGVLRELTIPNGRTEGHELLVGIHAIAQRLACDGKAASWHALGVIITKGCKVLKYKNGDRLWQNGDGVPGISALELQLVDARSINPQNHTPAPGKLSASLMASELVTHKLELHQIPASGKRVVLLQGAYASAGEHLLHMMKLLPHVIVVATAPSAINQSWLLDQGADHVISEHEAAEPQLQRLGLGLPLTDVISLHRADADFFNGLFSDVVQPA